MKLKCAFLSLSLCLLLCFSCSLKTTEYYINTVTGKINSDSLKTTLTHEHVMSRFGAEQDYNAVYDTLPNYNQILPYLKKIKSLGVSSIFDCTTAYFGRNVKTLEKLSKESGIQIITNTGFYGAYNDVYVPKFAFDLNDDEIAKIWIKEFEEGIDGTGIKPGFIKLAFDDGEPSNIDLKLFEAGLKTHLKTGLTLAVHTGNNSVAAKKQMELLTEFNIDFNNWIWTHANKFEDINVLINAAKKGAWISLDGVNDKNIDEYIAKLKRFKKENLLGNVLISHDGNSLPNGRKIRSYDAIMIHLILNLKTNGFSDDDIQQLTVINPKLAFRIKHI